MSKRFEEYHGYDRPQPPPEPPEWTMPTDCPECGGTGEKYIPGETSVFEGEKLATRTAPNVAPCLYCKGHGTVELSRKVGFYFSKWITNPLLNQNHGT